MLFSLQELIGSSKKRIGLASLYLGNGNLEKRLVSRWCY